MRKPTYQQLERRLAAAEPVVEALKRQEVDAVVGEEKIAFLLLRKVEEAWLESSAEFSAMFNLDGIGMIQADAPAFSFTRVNSKFCEIAGYSAEELLTMSYIGFTHPQDRTNDLRHVGRVIRGKSDSWAIEKRCVRKDGRVIWVDVHAFALRDHAGQAGKIVAMVEDITARREAVQQQCDPPKPSNKLLKELTAQLLQLLGSLGNQAARRKLDNEVVRMVQKLFDASHDRKGDGPAARRGKPPRGKQASLDKSRKSAGRSSSGKTRRWSS